MKKFVIHVLKGKTSIVEVECEKVSAMEDPSVMWLPKDEFKVRIIKPSFLHEKQNNGSLTPVIYMSWSLFDSQEVALFEAQKDLKSGMVRSCAKAHCDPPTLEQIEEAISKIEVVPL